MLTETSKQAHNERYVMVFTVKTGSTTDIRADLKKQKERAAERESKGDSKFAKWIPNKDTHGELVVRFLSNPENQGWVSYSQFFVPGSKGGVIETEENSDYYREELDLWPSKRWYAPILDRATNEVGIVDLPDSIVQGITNLADRWGGPEKDLREFDIALYKLGAKKDTKYFAEYAGGHTQDLSEYELPNLIGSLELKVNYQEGNLKKRDKDASDDIENETVGADEPPFTPDEPKEAEVAPKKRVIKRKASA